MQFNRSPVPISEEPPKYSPLCVQSYRNIDLVVHRQNKPQQAAVNQIFKSSKSRSFKFVFHKELLVDNENERRLYQYQRLVSFLLCTRNKNPSILILQIPSRPQESFAPSLFQNKFPMLKMKMNDATANPSV